MDAGISIQQIPANAPNGGTLYAVSGDSSVKGVTAEAEAALHTLRFVAAGPTDPKSWKLTVADGITICQNAANPQALLASGTEGATNVISIVSVGKPLAALLLTKVPPDPTQAAGQPTAIQNKCP